MKRPVAAGAFAGALAVLALAPVSAQAVTNTSPPTITPAEEPKRDQQQLGSTPGTWTLENSESDLNLAHQWERCNPGCVAIGGATGSSYLLTPADIGSRMRLTVTATCTGCATPESASSATTGVVEALPPQNVLAPALGGTFVEDQLGGAFAGSWTGTAPITLALQWQRCATLNPVTCQTIPGATGVVYQFTTADVNQRVRVLVTADNPAAGTAGPVSSEILGPVARAPAATLPLLSPFPVIAIGGKLTTRGAALRLLRVRGPNGSRVAVRCRGRSCPFGNVRRTLRRRGELRVRGLERSLRAGTVIELRITKPGTIGKYTRFTIRKGKPPTRRDACVRPGATKASACPRR